MKKLEQLYEGKAKKVFKTEFRVLITFTIIFSLYLTHKENKTYPKEQKMPVLFQVR